LAIDSQKIYKITVVYTLENILFFKENISSWQCQNMSPVEKLKKRNFLLSSWIFAVSICGTMLQKRSILKILYLHIFFSKFLLDNLFFWLIYKYRR